MLIGYKTMSFNASSHPHTPPPQRGSLVYSPLSQFITSSEKAMRQIQSISHSLKDVVTIVMIKDLCDIKHGER